MLSGGSIRGYGERGSWSPYRRLRCHTGIKVPYRYSVDDLRFLSFTESDLTDPTRVLSGGLYQDLGDFIRFVTVDCDEW